MPKERTPKVPRHESRRQRRLDGEQAGTLASRLMALDQAEVEQLSLDEDLAYEIEQARRITSMNARRREQRRLAGVLRSYDLDAVTEQLDAQQQTRQADGRLFKLAESWRDRLIDDESALSAFLQEHPEIDPKPWHRLVNDARRQRTTGKPKGAGRTLFRQVIDALS